MRIIKYAYSVTKISFFKTIDVDKYFGIC
jgi:hypothetical protein